MQQTTTSRRVKSRYLLEVILALRPNIDFGSPNATITWSVNGGVLEENAPNVEISSEGVLTVTNIQSGGNYTITSNTAGNSSDTVNVILGMSAVIDSYMLFWSLLQMTLCHHYHGLATTSTSAATRTEDTTTVNSPLLMVHSISLLLAGEL